LTFDSASAHWAIHRTHRLNPNRNAAITSQCWDNEKEKSADWNYRRYAPSGILALNQTFWRALFFCRSCLDLAVLPENYGKELRRACQPSQGSFLSLNDKRLSLGSNRLDLAAFSVMICAIPRIVHGKLQPLNDYEIHMQSMKAILLWLRFTVASRLARTLVIAVALPLALISHHAAAQPVIQWQATFGGTNYDQIDSVLQTADGGYLLGGYSESGASGNKTNGNFGLADYWIIKVNTNGIKQWEKGFGGSSNDFFHAVQPTGDGGYLLAGSSYSSVSGNKTNGNFGIADYWLVKVDANGNKLWERVYGGSQEDFVWAMQPAGNGAFVIGGESASGISGNKTNGNFGGYDFWLVKVDTNGLKLWEKEYGGTGDEYFYAILPTSDGGFLLGGESNSTASGNKSSSPWGRSDFWVVKVDANGNKQWDRVYGGTSGDWLECIVPTADGGYLLGGTSQSGASGSRTAASFGLADYWIIKVDQFGVEQWDRAFGGTDNDYLDTMVPTSDGGFLLGGFSYSPASGNKSGTNYGREDYWLVKIDANGNKLWDQVYGGSDYDDLYTMLATSDSGQLLGGTSRSPVSGNKTNANFGDGDCWVVKLATLPRLTVVRAGPGQAAISWTPNTPGFVLQEKTNLMSGSWSNSPSGSTNPITVPDTMSRKLYRLFKP
jgi:hypothetical protein